jgi:hypothetical protein
LKYTIEGFSQVKLIEYDLDVVDALMLRYFIDFKDSGKMTSKYVNEKLFYWVSYDGVIQELPILSLNKPDSVYRRLKKMVSSKILETITIKQGGTYSYYRTGVNYLSLLSDSNPDGNPNQTDKNPYSTDRNPGSTDKNPNQTDENPEQKTHLLYPSTTNPSTTNPIKEVFDLFNSICTNLSKVIKLSDGRKRTIKSILDKYPDIETIKEVFANANKSSFLTGSNERGWTADFDWVLKESNFIKILEGKYENKTPKPQQQKGNFNNFDQRSYDDDFIAKLEASHRG